MTLDDLGVRIDALGSKIDAMDRKFEDKIDTLQAVMNERFDRVETQIIGLENRVACVEGAVANLQHTTPNAPAPRRQRGVTVAQDATL